MKLICTYTLYAKLNEDYSQCIPAITKLSLPKDSQVLSVLGIQTGKSMSIRAYVEESDDAQQVVKLIALVTDSLPDKDGLGWRFINSFVISTGSKDYPQNTTYHAYVKIC